MTRGVKILGALWLVIIVSAALLLVARNLEIRTLEQASQSATIAGAFIATGALAVAASEYYLRKRRDEEENRPYVSVALAPLRRSPHLFEIIIKNIGKSAAKNVKVKFSPNQILRGSKVRVNDIKALQNLKFLAPNSEMRFFFGSYLHEGEPEMSIKRIYKIRVDYVDLLNKEWSGDFIYDPRDYEGLTMLTSKSIHHIAETLEKIAETQNKLVKYHKKFTDSTIEDGIKVRNTSLVGLNAHELLRLVVSIYENHGENELIQKPTVYDFKLLVKQCRDLILAEGWGHEQSHLIAELNSIIEKDWDWRGEEVERHFEKLISLNENNIGLSDIVN